MLKFLEQAVSNKDTSVITEAKEKLQNEIEQSENNPLIKYIGEYLIKELSINTELAEIIVNTDKTIAKSFDTLKVEAEKRSNENNNMEMVTIAPDEGFAIIMDYFRNVNDKDEAAVEN